MYNQGSDQEKIDSTTPHYPQPDAPGGPMSPPQYPPGQTNQPPPQPGFYPPPQQMGGGYPAPVHQQPTSTMHNTNTTVVIQQQPAAIVVQGPRGWSTGMLSCFDDCGVCMLGLCSCLLCCPCIQYHAASSAGECCCVGTCCPIALRTKIRTKHNIQGSIVDDWCALTWCYYCAFCQMQREVNINGI